MAIKSTRRKDVEGRLRVDNCAFTKATVNPYFGSEVPNGVELQLDPDKVYQVYRPLDELERAIDTFKGVQIMDFHTTVDADGPNGPKRLHTIGNLCSTPVVDGDKLRADMIFYDKTAISDIEEDRRAELSASYIFDGVKESGTFEGLPYDIKMTNIRANHVALVKTGRAGPDVRVADQMIRANDSMPIDMFDANDLKGFKMKLPAFAAFVNTALVAMRANDSKEISVGDIETMLQKTANDESEGKIDADEKIKAEDGEVEVKADGEVVEDSDVPEAVQRLKEHLTPEQYADLCEMARSMVAKPAGDEDDMSDEDKKKAADEAEAAKKEEEKAAEDRKRAGDAALLEQKIRREITEFNTACEDVRSVVVIKRAQDSSFNAADVYKSALAELKVPVTGIDSVEGLKTLFNASKGASITRTEDSAKDPGLEALFGKAVKLDTYGAGFGSKARVADASKKVEAERSSFIQGLGA